MDNTEFYQLPKVPGHGLISLGTRLGDLENIGINSYIRDIAFYDKKLTADEITAIFENE